MAGKVLFAIRNAHRESEDEMLQLVVTSLLVPTAYRSYSPFGAYDTREGVSMSQSSGLTGQEYGDIYNLYGYYNHSSDLGAPEEYASCFTPDGVLDAAGGLLVKGKESLTTYKRNEQAGRSGRYRRHWNGSIYLEKLADGSVRGRCYVPVLRRPSGASRGARPPRHV